MNRFLKLLAVGALVLPWAASAQPCNQQQGRVQGYQAQVPYGHYYCAQHGQYCNHPQSYSTQPTRAVMYSAPSYAGNNNWNQGYNANNNRCSSNNSWNQGYSGSNNWNQWNNRSRKNHHHQNRYNNSCQSNHHR